MATVYTRVKNMSKDVITAADSAFLKDIKITQEESSYVVSFDVTDVNYLKKWLARTGAQHISNYKEKVRIEVQSTIGDVEDRLADAFKFNYLTLKLLSEVYGTLTDASKKKLSDEVVATLDKLQETFEAKEESFNLGNDLLGTLNKLTSREKFVKKCIDKHKPVNTDLGETSLNN